jgi:acetolactate synthase-1/2/3 large subunit
MNVSEQIVAALESQSVQYIFGVPGEETLDFMAAMKSSNIQFIVTRHEQGAVPRRGHDPL